MPPEILDTTPDPGEGHQLTGKVRKEPYVIIGNALGLARARRLVTLAGRVIVSGRRMSLLIPAAAAGMWSCVLARIRSSRLPVRA